MKRLLLFLTCVLTLFGVSQAKEVTYTGTVTKSLWSTSGSGAVSLDGVSWTLGVDSKVTSTRGYDGTYGQQIGSNSSNNGGVITLSTDGIVGTIKSITVNSSVNSGKSANLSVKVGDSTWGSAQNVNTKLNNAFTFTGTGSGTIQIQWSLTSQTAIYFKTIKVVYDDGEGSTKSTYTAPFANQSYTVNEGENVDLGLGSTYPSSLKFTSSSNNISISGTTITGVSPTTNPVTVNASWGDDKYEDGSASFTVTVNAKGTDPVDPTPGGDRWVLVNKNTDLEAGAKYIIGHKNGSNFYAMNTTVSSNRILSDIVTVVDDILTPVSTTAIFELVAEADGKWKLKLTNDGSSKGQYLNVNSGSTDLNFNSNVTANSISFDNSGYVMIDNGSRRAFPNTSNEYRSFASNNNWTSSSYCKTSLFKYVTSSTSEPPVEKPGIPVVKIGDEELEDGGEKTVAVDTKLTITSEGATSIEGFFGDDPVKLTTAPFEYTITKSGEFIISGINEAGESESFSYTFTVGEVDPNMPAVGSTFKQILNKETELVADAYYVIARNYNDVKVAMSKTDNNGTFASTSNVEIEEFVQNYYDAENTKVKDRKFSILKTTGDDVLILKLVEQDGQFGLKTVNYGDGFESSQKYLYGLEDGTAIKFADEFKPAYINIAQNVKISFTSEATRQIYYNSNNGTFNYQKQSSSNIQLYKYTTAKKFEPQYEDIKIKAGETKTINPGVEEHPDITYKVKGTTVCVRVEGDEIIAQDMYSTDEATIMAEWPDSEEWFGNLVEFKVTFRYPAKLEFRHGIEEENPVRGKKDVGVVWQAVYYTGDGTVEYSVEPNTVGINKTTGQIRPIDIADAVADGETLYKVTAHVEGEEGSFVEGDAHYYFVIDAPDASEEGSDGKDFTESFGNNGPSVNNYDNWETLLPTTYSDKTTTHESKNTGIEYSMSYMMVQQQSNNFFIQMQNDKSAGKVGNLSFTLPKYCIGIELKAGVTSSASAKVDFAIDNKTKLTGVELTTSANAICNFDASDGTNVMTITPNSQTPKIAAIIFKMAKVDASDGTEAGLAFNDEDRIVNIFAGEEKTLPGLIHNPDLEWKKYYTEDKNAEGLSFDIDEIDEWDEEETFQNYTITPTDFNNIKVTVNNPGVYTFRAQYKGQDFLDGMAILRLNVFPRLEVVPTDDSKLADDSRTEVPELTIAHPDEEGGEVATIAMPSMAKLDDFKYSTVKIKVVVNHGGVETVYDYDKEKPASFEFTEDGSITYTLLYGETYELPTTVNVVLMPQVPAVDTSASESAVITPSKNSYLQYHLTATRRPVSGDSPDNLGDLFSAKRRVAVSDEWTTVDSKDTPYTFSQSEIEGYDEAYDYTLEFRSMKDLTDNIEGYEHEAGSELYSDVWTVNLASDGNVTVGVDDVIADDEDALFFDVNGYQVDGDRLEKGRIYIKVVNGTAVKVVK